MIPHRCHWPRCERTVPARMYACRQHWFTLPRPLRAAILATYSPGQEIRKNPTPAYLEAARRARRWAEDQLETETRQHPTP